MALRETNNSHFCVKNSQSFLDSRPFLKTKYRMAGRRNLFRSEALRESLGYPLGTEGAVRRKAQGEDCLS
jgi:hypothetical protein